MRISKLKLSLQLITLFCSMLLLSGAASERSLKQPGNNSEKIENAVETPQNAYSMSGFVKDKDFRRIKDVSLILTGPKNDSCISADDGSYRFENLSAGKYSIVPAKKGYKFNSLNVTINKQSENIENQDIIGIYEGKTFTISGFVMDNRRSALKDVLMVLSGGISSIGVTACDGKYEYKNLPQGPYTISVSKPGHDFRPEKRVFKNLHKDKKRQYFVGYTDIVLDADELNIAGLMPGIQAIGWGEYRTNGKCLCCDNFLDGDCIVIGNVERTDKIRVPQVIDIIKSTDTSDANGYFGDVIRRDDSKFVANMYLKISLPEKAKITKAIIWTQIKDKKSMLSNCEFGFVDDFDRIQWVSKVENNVFNDHIFIDLKQAVFTREILIRIYNGSQRITEVELYSKE